MPLFLPVLIFYASGTFTTIKNFSPPQLTMAKCLEIVRPQYEKALAAAPKDGAVVGACVPIPDANPGTKI